MKKSIIIFLALFFISSGISIPLTNSNSNDESTYFVIKVTVYDRFNNCANGALVRCIGPSYDQCCNVVSCTCGFTVNSTGYYTICSSQSNYGGNGSVNVVPGIFIYNLTIYLNNPGETCESCPGSK
jgi:hypothetical protein